jgi:hypothetical protein
VQLPLLAGGDEHWWGCVWNLCCTGSVPGCCTIFCFIKQHFVLVQVCFNSEMQAAHTDDVGIKLKPAVFIWGQQGQPGRCGAFWAAESAFLSDAVFLYLRCIEPPASRQQNMPLAHHVHLASSAKLASLV